MLLEQVVSSAKDLPSLPAITYRVIKLVDDAQSTAKDLNDVITQDQSLTAKVLRLANSAYYGFPRRISTVTDAIVLLGFNTIRSLVLSASVYPILEKPLEGYALAPGELWRHSQACAMGARLIAQRARYRQPDQAYIAGLLHDIGKVLLNHHLRQQYQEIVARVGGEVTFIEVEQEVLGFDHAQVGALLAEKWNLPPDLVEAIGCHHQPKAAEKNRELTAITHLADALCMTMGLGLGVDGLYYKVEEDAVRLLKIKEEELEQLISRLADTLADRDTLLY